MNNSDVPPNDLYFWETKTPPVQLVIYVYVECWSYEGVTMHSAVVDPGFPRGGGSNPPGGSPTYDFAKFSQKLHEIERIWTGGVARVPRAAP